jgi:hypothetical protein
MYGQTLPGDKTVWNASNRKGEDPTGTDNTGTAWTCEYLDAIS